MEPWLLLLVFLYYVLLLAAIGAVLWAVITLFPIIRLIFCVIIDLVKGCPPPPPSPYPDDWPPENSVRFIPLIEKELARQCDAWSRIPGAHKGYCLGSNWEDEDDLGEEVGRELIQTFCRGRTVLTLVDSTHEPFSVGDSLPPPRFTEWYRDFLGKTRPSAEVLAEGETTLWVLDTENAYDAWTVYEESPCNDSIHVMQYVFRVPGIPRDMAEAREYVRDGAYDLRLVPTQYPGGVIVTFNPHTVPEEELCRTVEEICQRQGVLLSNPPPVCQETEEEPHGNC